MSTEPDDDDWGGKREQPARTPQPGITRAAGILWVVMGVIFFLFGCLNIVTTAALQVQQPNRRATGTEGCPVWLSFGIGAALFVAGMNLASGKAKDVLTASILSIILGLFYAVVTVGSTVFLARGGGMMLVLGGVGLVISLGCVLPGVLALSGRSRYRAWRRANRHRNDQDNEDDFDEDRGGDDRGPDARPWERGRRGPR